ncbi:hypothetical protein MMC14_006340 [Varicellaria rhodocarpa]|nr:hypothetical protein [Varicellaria rhodocarpa]
MHYSITLVAAALCNLAHTLPVTSSSVSATAPTPSQLNDPTYGPIPGQSTIYSQYRGVSAPFPAKGAEPILPTTTGPPGADDLLFQNLLAVEWIVFYFYQQGVEAFNASSFTTAGYPNSTYDRLLEIRDNEAGHLRIFQDSITSNSIKPGPCQYDYGFTDVGSFLGLQILIEYTSQAFLTGLTQQAQLNVTKGAIVAISQVETRHATWALLDIWNTNPFVGPSDTSFPYANQILDLTHLFLVNGSCPPENPAYPIPSQHLPRLDYAQNTTSLNPGDEIQFTIGSPAPAFANGTDYFAVFIHGVFNITVPYDVESGTATYPGVIEDRGVTIVLIADESGAPTLESVLAGPLVIVNQPAQLATSV